MDDYIILVEDTNMQPYIISCQKPPSADINCLNSAYLIYEILISFIVSVVYASYLLHAIKLDSINFGPVFCEE